MFAPGGPTFFELARQALSSTDQGYTLLAPKFDKTPFRTPPDLLSGVAAWIGPVHRAVDLCCGTGAAMIALVPHVDEELVGVDRNQAMLDVAAKNLAENAAGARSAPWSLQCSDVLTWQGEGRFDLAVSFGAFGHILPEQEPAFLAAVFRALRPGGRFVFVTGARPGPGQPVWWLAQGFNFAMRTRNLLIQPPFHMYYLTFTWPEIEPLLRQTGFECRVHRGVLPAPYARALVIEAIRPLDPPHP
jgi:cyclopropane fatty-acyl-phospholipid synthase-like methyltransferase